MKWSDSDEKILELIFSDTTKTLEEINKEIESLGGLGDYVGVQKIEAPSGIIFDLKKPDEKI